MFSSFQTAQGLYENPLHLKTYKFCKKINFHISEYGEIVFIWKYWHHISVENFFWHSFTESNKSFPSANEWYCGWAFYTEKIFGFKCSLPGTAESCHDQGIEA